MADEMGSMEPPNGRSAEASDRRPSGIVQSVAVAVNDDDDGRSGRKRPATQGQLLDERADAKRRNRRLFGAILGTLQKFSRDEEQARQTAAAQRRAELEQRAQEKLARESMELRQQARDEMRQMREGMAMRKREMSAHRACGRLEAAYAARLARADKLCTRFLRTKTGPPLYWCPGWPCPELDRLAEQQRQEHAAWKAGQMEQLEREKAELTARMLAGAWRGPRPGGEGDEGGERGGGGSQQPQSAGEDADEEMEAAEEAGGEGGSGEAKSEAEGQPPLLEGEQEMEAVGEQQEEQGAVQDWQPQQQDAGGSQ